MSEPQPVRSVLLVAGDLVDAPGPAAVRALTDRLTAAGHMVTVLVSPAAADRAVDFLDALRVDGVPVQVCRRATGLERRTGPLGALAVTVTAVVDSGADSLHVMPGAEHLLPHLGLARRSFLRGIGAPPLDRLLENDGR